MSSSATLPNPTDRATQRDEDAQYYRAILHELVEMATDIARTVHRQATTEQPAKPTPGAAAQPQPPQPDPAIAFDRIARTIRRTIALARKLSEPDREAPGPKSRPTDRPKEHCAEGCDECCPSARQRRTDCAETDALHAEPCERPEEPDFDADEDLDDALDDQSFADLIASLRHDTGLATLTDAQLRQRHTPGDVRDLCARATGQPTAGVKTGAKASGQTGSPPPPAPPRPTRTSTGPP